MRYAVALSLLCVVTFFAAYEIWPWQLDAPLHSEGDLRQACRLMKSWLEGSYYTCSHLGAPFVAEHYGFPETWAIHLPVLWLFSKFTDNIYLIYNWIFVATFPLAGVAAYAVMRRLECRPLPALLASWLYAFLPNHLERYEHCGISMYFTAPLAVWLALSCQQQGRLTPRQLLLAPLGGLCGPYPAAFNCLVMGFGGLLGGWERRSPRPLAWALLAMALTAGTFGLVLLPAWRHYQPQDAFLPSRAPSDLTRWAMAFDHLLLPAHARDGHPLSGVARRYYENFPAPEEPDEAPYLGILTLLGALCLLLYRGPGLARLRRLGFLLFLLGTTAGLGQVLTLLLGPTIRCYNRLSFYLAFVCLTALAYCLSQLKVSRRGWLLLGLVTAAGVLEHVVSGPHRFPEADRRAAASDRAFVAQLESRLPAEARLWQMPYVPYPESPPLGSEGHYGLGRGYIVSHRLHWSWGTLRGHRQERYQQALAQLPLARQREILQASGFSGIVLDRRADPGRVLEKQLGGPELVSPDEQLLYFPLPGATLPRAEAERIFVEQVTAAAWNHGVLDFTRAGWGRLFARAGWSEAESDGTWSVARRAWLSLPRGKRLRLLLTPYLGGIDEQQIQVWQGERRLAWWAMRSPRAYELECVVSQPQRLELRILRPGRPSALGAPDTRNLGIKLHRITVLD